MVLLKGVDCAGATVGSAATAIGGVAGTEIAAVHVAAADDTAAASTHVAAANSRCATVAGIAAVVAVIIVVVVIIVGVHVVDASIRLLVVGGGREGSHVGVDVLGRDVLLVARQVAVELVVLGGVYAEEGCDTEEEADEDVEGNDALAGATLATTLASRVVRSLCSKGGQPEDAEQDVDGNHDVRLGETAGAREARDTD